MPLRSFTASRPRVFSTVISDAEGVFTLSGVYIGQSDDAGLHPYRLGQYEFARVSQEHGVEVMLRCQWTHATEAYFAIVDYLAWNKKGKACEILRAEWRGDHVCLTVGDYDAGSCTHERPIPTSTRNATFVTI